jgi:hypothetical protein
LASKFVLGSDLNLADVSNNLVAETLKKTGMDATAVSMDATITAWNALPASTEAEIESKRFTELIYSISSPSGEALVVDSSGVLSVPFNGYTSANLTAVYSAYAATIITQAGVVTDATDAKPDAVTKNGELVATQNTLDANVNTAGSILYAGAQVSTAETARAARKAVLVAAASTDYNELYGIDGTAAAPNAGFLKTLNETRVALDNLN